MTETVPAIDIEVAVESADIPAIAELEQWIQAALAAQQSTGSVALRIVDADESQQLNRDWRDKDRPTNVLSFPADALERESLGILGDLAICAPVVAREAQEQGKTLRAHWAHMLVHGMLHLLGYDHVTDADAAVMEQTEKDILAGLGFADPYQQDELN